MASSPYCGLGLNSRTRFYVHKRSCASSQQPTLGADQRPPRAATKRKAPPTTCEEASEKKQTEQQQPPEQPEAEESDSMLDAAGTSISGAAAATADGSDVDMQSARPDHQPAMRRAQSEPARSGGFSCPQCGETFTASSSRSRHCQGPTSVHPTAKYVGPTFTCVGCRAVFKFAQKATKHLTHCTKLAGRGKSTACIIAGHTTEAGKSEGGVALSAAAKTKATSADHSSTREEPDGEPPAKRMKPSSGSMPAEDETMASTEESTEQSAPRKRRKMTIDAAAGGSDSNASGNLLSPRTFRAIQESHAKEEEEAAAVVSSALAAPPSDSQSLAELAAAASASPRLGWSSSSSPSLPFGCPFCVAAARQFFRTEAELSQHKRKCWDALIRIAIATRTPEQVIIITRERKRKEASKRAAQATPPATAKPRATNAPVPRNSTPPSLVDSTPMPAAQAPAAAPTAETPSSVMTRAATPLVYPPPLALSKPELAAPSTPLAMEEEKEEEENHSVKKEAGDESVPDSAFVSVRLKPLPLMRAAPSTPSAPVHRSNGRSSSGVSPFAAAGAPMFRLSSPPTISTSAGAAGAPPAGVVKRRKRGPPTIRAQTCPFCHRHWESINDHNFNLHVGPCRLKQERGASASASGTFAPSLAHPPSASSTNTTPIFAAAATPTPTSTMTPPKPSPPRLPSAHALSSHQPIASAPSAAASASTPPRLPPPLQLPPASFPRQALLTGIPPLHHHHQQQPWHQSHPLTPAASFHAASLGVPPASSLPPLGPPSFPAGGAHATPNELLQMYGGGHRSSFRGLPNQATSSSSVSRHPN